jgi:arylformamidase
MVEHIHSGAVNISRWTLGSHAGTHVDAPVHFSCGAKTVDQLDSAVLLGPCRVLDLLDFDRVTAAILQAHHLAGVDRLLLRTRNSLHWAENATLFDEEFVALDVDAARLLVASGVKLVGVDGLSVESFRGNSGVHETLLNADIIILEGLNLAEVPAGDYQLICAPLLLHGSDGAPARVFLQDRMQCAENNSG